MTVAWTKVTAEEGEKWLGSDYILKVEPPELDDGLDERKRTGKDDTKDFWPWQLKLWNRY